jgi:hypothetical protein
MSRPDYRPFVPALGQSRIAGDTPREHAQARTQSARAKELFGTWEELAKASFTGITTDGHVIPNLFSLKPSDAPTAEMIAAVRALLGSAHETTRLLTRSEHQVPSARRTPLAALRSGATICIGSGNTMVEFLSAAITVSVSKFLSRTMRNFV